MRFAENLMGLRRGRGWSQEELGDRLGVSRQTVSKWETGQTTPELEKLVELAAVFDRSIDELVGREAPRERPGSPAVGECFGCPRRRVYYEYISPRRLWGLPLVHVRLGGGNRPVRGIVAVGNVAVGLVALGGIGVGVVSLAGLSVGLLALGGMALGAVSAGGVALGLCAAGGVAMGQWLAIGGVAASNQLAVGGVALSHQLAVGKAAVGAIAVGVEADGALTFALDGDGAAIWQAVERQFPGMWGAAKLFLP
ncbi:MAG: helix-turn-helix transcriptional regulator [Oscillospiraceae bacterium]|nr:helix-turn-helix transcriptional regulator [Oscillospiraceae bacterium]